MSACQEYQGNPVRKRPRGASTTCWEVAGCAETRAVRGEARASQAHRRRATPNHLEAPGGAPGSSLYCAKPRSQWREMPSRAGRSQRRKGRGGVSERDEEVRRAREEMEELEAERLRLSGAVMRGDVEARNEDRQLERRLQDLSRLIMRAEQEEKDELRAG